MNRGITLVGLLACCAVAGGCQFWAAWTPMYGDSTLKEHSINTDGLALKSELGFLSNSFNPELRIWVRNLTKERATWDLDQITLIIDNVRIAPHSGSAVLELKPGQSKKAVLVYRYSLDHRLADYRGRRVYVPVQQVLTVEFGSATIGGRAMKIPSVKYTDAFPPDRRMKFI